MIEKLFRFRACPWFAAQPNTFFDSAIDHLCFRSRFENLIERRIGGGFVDFLEPEIALESLSANWSLLHAQRGKAMRELCVIEIAVLAQAFDHCFNGGPGCAAAFQQTLTQFRN